MIKSPRVITEVGRLQKQLGQLILRVGDVLPKGERAGSCTRFPDGLASRSPSGRKQECKQEVSRVRASEVEGSRGKWIDFALGTEEI